MAVGTKGKMVWFTLTLLCDPLRQKRGGKKKREEREEERRGLV
jgi:hypothetical protein